MDNQIRFVIHVCKYCNTAHTKDEYNLHILENHKCKVCKNMFASLEDLNSHFKSNHKCNKCKKVFFNLEIHKYIHRRKYTLTSINTEKRIRPPVTCNICGKKFAHRGNLNAHLSSHSDNKTYECVKCSNTYKRKSSLIRHIKIYHLDIIY